MNRVIGILMAFAIVAFVSMEAKAQAGRGEVRGVVKDALGQPIAQARVFLRTADGKAVAQAQTSDDGRFTFRDVTPGTYAIVAEKSRYQQGTSIVALGDTTPAEAIITMASEQALDVRVATERLDRARTSLSQRTGSSQYTFDQQDVEALPEGENTAFNQVLLQAPGVTNDSFGQLHIRGEHANVQYRINGIIIPEPISGFGQSFDTRIIDQLNLLTGALPAQYGDQTAGIVDIHTKNGDQGNGGSIDVFGGSHQTIQT